jgi:hypothetical protein
MVALLVQYLGIVAVACCERQWPRALYFLSAAGITVAVLWMGRKGQWAT